MKRIILALIILNCSATLYPYIIENETPFQITITSKKASGPKLKTDQMYILNPVTIDPWKTGGLPRSVVRYRVGKGRSAPETGPYQFIRTVQIKSNPPVRFSIRADFESSGVFRKKSHMRNYREKLSVSLPNKPFFSIFEYHFGIHKTGFVRATGTYELGKVILNKQERHLIIQISSSRISDFVSQPVITIKIV